MKRNVTLFLELLIIPIVVLPLYIWGNQLSWSLDAISALTVFPLLGLVAFSIMWWHFLLGFVKDIEPSFEKIKALHKTSSILVFLLIILHPILLSAYSLANNLPGPPAAYYNYVVSSKAVFVTYGILALTIFLLYDVAHWLKTKPWVEKNWLIIDAIDDVAFMAIFFHSMAIGQHLQSGWFRYVWIFYGVSAIIFIGYKHYRRFTQNEEDNTDQS